MPDSNQPYKVGYAKPPRETRFVKGKSGNPKGRPRGAQNLATILAKVGKERVKVSGKNGSRTITKLEASLIQLSNQAASGELRAIREFLYWIKSFQNSELNPATFATDERDKAVIANIIKRIQKSGDRNGDERESSDSETSPLDTE